MSFCLIKIESLKIGLFIDFEAAKSPKWWSMVLYGEPMVDLWCFILGFLEKFFLLWCAMVALWWRYGKLW